jgi:anaerobic magnesium-protoporphyrin IX monomethyl ester cyclase
MEGSMKVVLSTPPGKTTELWPPLGLLYIASSTRAKRSDDIRVIDAFCENLSQEELVSRVVKERPDVFGMNCSTHTFLDTIGTLGRLRKELPEVKLVLGGFHATFAAERIMRKYPFLDFLVKGEAELSFPKLLDHIEKGTPPDDVDGIGYRMNGKTIGREPVLNLDLDSLTFPARELAREVEYGYYHKNIKLTFGKFTTISSSRGCPYRCTYCSCAAFSQRKWRPRSPENVVDELEQLYEQGYECLVFVDDNLTHSKPRMERICDLIRERRIRMRFYCEGRADNASPELLRRMKHAGFDVIYFGIESPQANVLEYYRKTVRAERAERAIFDARSAGLLVLTSYIVGAPVESLEDMNKTIEFILRTRPHAVQINILDVLIGTEIWERLEAQGVIRPDDWMTNHRIYEYSLNAMTRSDLEEVVNRGYAAHIDAWKSGKGLVELLRTLYANKTARRIVMGNIMNPSVRSRISDARRYQDPGARAEPAKVT